MYVSTGLWGVVHLRSFMRVTGPKDDLWLVRTVGALVTVIGAVLLIAAARNRPTVELTVLGSGSALALSVVDLFYAGSGRISRVYLLDALSEIALITLLVRAVRDSPR
jgi:hypothetical protein